MRLVLLLAILTGCASKPRVTYLPSGQLGYTAKCYFNVDKCYNKAGEMCGGPYEVISLNTTRDSDDDSYSMMTYTCKEKKRNPASRK
jgi:hypothetical protein